MKNKICLIIPCYNEEHRLDFSSFRKISEDISFVFVNDGSTDGTLKLLLEHASGNFLVHNLEKNSGKAEAVRQGMLFAESNSKLKDFEWFGFWDADLATPLTELENLLLYRDLFYPDAVAVFGSRIKRLGGSISRSALRHLLGRIFATIFRLVFKVNSYDSQCGAKIFRRNCVRKAFADKFYSRWIFDVEIMIRLRELNLVEYPLREWSDVGGSKVMNCRNFIIIIRDIFRLWKKYG
jgi:dolichyl-phosphate beta-glucosyltransferase